MRGCSCWHIVVRSHRRLILNPAAVNVTVLIVFHILIPATHEEDTQLRPDEPSALTLLDLELSYGSSYLWPAPPTSSPPATVMTNGSVSLQSKLQICISVDVVFWRNFSSEAKEKHLMRRLIESECWHWTQLKCGAVHYACYWTGHKLCIVPMKYTPQCLARRAPSWW